MAVQSLVESRLARVTVLVDQLTWRIEANRLPKTHAEAARRQIAELIDLLASRDAPDARLLSLSLRRLADRLEQVGSRLRARPADAVRNRRLLRALRRIALIVTAGVAMAVPLAAAARDVPTGPLAAPPAPGPIIQAVVVGDPIIHPVTGASLTVTAVVPNGVIATGDLFILTTTTVGAMLPDPADPALSVTIASVTVNAGTMLIERVTFTDARTLDVVTVLDSAPSAPPGGTITLPAGAGDINFVSDVRRGSGGGGGRDGALFVSANSGGAGGSGPSFDVVVGAGHGAITTVSPGLPGVIAASIGGNGGNGGDGYLGASGASGGQGGAGGNVTLTSQAVSISTTGDLAHGIVAQSRAGIGGAGGSGFVFSSGGGGGGGNSGGSATATNFSTITTRGIGAHGVFAQSLGGGAGDGGGSYGIFGSGGSGNSGGNGGSAEAINHGLVTTLGNLSYGVSAQSVGGIGGDAGTAVGLITFTSDGAGGGNGGSAIVRAQTGSEVRTEGVASYGLFAQSIGGGGGNGGLSAGLVSLGSGGGTGGNGGTAQIFAQSGAFVTTINQSAHGVFAQSIGGGGGNGGISAGVVAIGSRGSSGGTGGAVTVESGAIVSTSGLDARGLFAQSVGGGGGTALGAGGLVALGGSGGGAGGAGTVSVTTSSVSEITTTQRGGDGIFAQSVGGGGGAGSASGGVVALGGGGGAGGNGNTVSVINNGTVTTGGDYARGVFAQSVGGGGGAGGDSGGLVTIGGSGSAASTGAAVTVTNAGAVTTTGDVSSALQVQSIGGGGGDGGSTGGVFLTIGGSGGGGGSSGLVTVNNSHNLTTGGNDSHGLFAQSVGGGGGSGGSTVSISAFAGVAIGGTGGTGGDGGVVDVNFADRAVTVGGAPQMVSPVIFTTGDRSRGAYVQSVGGGGGNGGFAAQVSAGYGVSASIAVGGSGGTGGLGGQVNMDGDVTILTQGDYSEGVFAQSVGGGGGNGGFALAFSFAAGETAAAAFSVGVGGSGGSGGAGGLVDVSSGGEIQTEGQFSTGFLTQSVGGGGGNGGFSVSIAGSAAGVASASVGVGVGGSGGSGGLGGTVDSDFDGTIRTMGHDSRAALIQSVGGGGGSGGFNVTGAVSISGAAGVGAAVGVGGYGGLGGTGGTVTGRVGGAVQTTGDRSTGVTIQSIGGGGGSGGFNVSGSIGGGGTFGGAVSVGVGGSGGSGGTGGAVTGTAGSTILTEGDQSGGLLVQSVGGGGGNGGFNVSASIAGSTTAGLGVSVGVGGAGGGGGAGGAVSGQAQGVVMTMGDQSAGVTVQSIGGGGGSGAFNVGASIGIGGTVGGALSVGVGGAGGGGGAGGEVDASSLGITTMGDQSGGFLAQSVGGGGGSGGFNVSGSIGGGSSVGAALSVGVGGSGGGGGNGARVGASVVGAVTTQGADSDGIVAQSVGGGGGNGAFTVAAGISGSTSASGSISVGVGGSGGGGGDSGNVTLGVTGTTQTTGANSDGIVAQSVGGGGGNGGFAITGNVAVSGGGAGTIGVAVGGTGGVGGDAGSVTMRVNDGVLDPTDTLVAALTLGDGARGVLAQSVGGGGGNGGFSIIGGISVAKAGAGNIGVGVGGGGGGGGNAGAVLGQVTGDVRTAGIDASAVLVQSVGGGGGNGGFNITTGISASKSVSGNILVGVGGFGDSGGDAGAVSGGVTGDILTLGDRSFGASYQSLGGGGGNGAFNIIGGISLAVASGGGAGTLGVGVGGFGGDGGDGSTVNASIIGDIVTLGHHAHGALFQSVGGGGGTGGFNITGAISASSGVSGTLGFGLGGFGGGGGSAGDVTGVLTGDVRTFGDESFGAMLQSLGGAGGNGGFNVTGAVSFTANNSASIGIGIGVGGFGGGGGNSGAVNGTVTGQYITSGNNADAVVAQSLGGGGGNGGLNVTGAIALGTGTAGTGSIGIGGFGGLGGNSGNVTLVRTGDTQTAGANSDGVIAQSLAGGGGNGAINVSAGVSASTGGTAGSLGIGIGGFGGGGGDAGNVVADITGNVHARGLESDITIPEITFDFPLIGELTFPGFRTRPKGSHGVIAQSVGGGGGNGGINITGQVSITAPGSQASRAVSIGIGGFGGSGGDAGTVDLTIDAPGATRVQVSAVGDDRSAVIAQSLGGGGGVGAINVSGSFAMDGTLTAGVGGFGGGGGLGRDVMADVDADLFAGGHRSRGLMVQSIGGGGGAGGINVSGGITADLATEEPAITFGLGGFGGAGNRSGNVTVTQNGQVMVEGVDSVGVLVQSVAGGGGSGGLNVAATLTAAGSTSSTRGYGMAVGVGGSGGDGADAGNVVVSSNGNIFVNSQPVVNPAPGASAFESVTFTGNSTGLLAQSIGGGGGVGGISATAVIAPFGNPVAIGVGGSGGSGGNAGTVSVTRGYVTNGGLETATPHVIRTFGEDSDGFVAQSIGGGGGRAGMNFTFAATVSPQGDSSTAALISVGGGGGGAGSGDAVTVRHNGDIITAGDSSDGLFAQSLGGGGGDADFNIGFGILRNSNALNLAVGGAVGAGGSGDTVSVDHVGTIITAGRASVGLRAQSIGGGGGNTSLDMAVGLLANNSLNMTLGRQGGAGGVGGNVTVASNGAIDTTGDEASAILAQSIGGGGGASSAITVGVSRTNNAGTPDARSYSGNVSVGLDGGVGATSGDVIVNTIGTITTRGDDARGVFAQSIGGGGGVGGNAGNVIFREAGSASVAVGGDGGTGATSGDVTVGNAATLVTLGDRSDGVLAQAIGGGGGLGGSARTIAIQLGGVPAGTTTRTAAVNVGGTGGTGAVGGNVSVTNTGIIATDGHTSFGIRAQSIGGGGGIGGAALNFRAQGTNSNDSVDVNIGGTGGTGGSAGTVTVLNEGLIDTNGRDAAGISANSIGGGGGDAGLVLDVVLGGTSADQQSHRFVMNLGGSGGEGGTGGAVTVTNRPTAAANTGRIITRGEGAYGIFAQSLGGGGGNGSSIISLTGLRSGPDSIVAGLNVGGTGGSGNTGGVVTVSNSGLIDTTGAGSHGILAQSIGGGGGNGGLVIAATALIGAPTNAPLIAIGGTGGDGGDGGAVNVTNSGLIVTRGANAHGIVAQSIGGGGGNAQMGFSLTSEPATLVLSNAVAALVGGLGGGTGGMGGVVTVNHSGDITVLGDGSMGIRAESINGGGGSLTLNFEGIVGLPGVPFIGGGGLPVVPDPLVVARAGGTGGSGMNAGSVNVNSTGTFGAGGANGVGSFNQSVGGGGGTVMVRAVLAVPIAPPIPAPADPDGALAAPGGPFAAPGDPPVPINFNIALGGVNGVDNNGGDILSVHTGAITTTGLNTPGALVQSIGGGGGRAVLDITAPAGTLLGGIDLALGGENGLNETGGDLTRIHSGGILTTGSLAPAAILQSIGGGGGSASVVLRGAGSTGAAVDSVLGANGGSGLGGGAVNGTFSGGIETRGANAIGLLAQSIGAGGGEIRQSGGGALNVLLGATGGADGDGGAVSVTNSGQVLTSGARSHGVFLQSIGGGGGAVFGGVGAPTVTLRNGNSGDGGTITFGQTGNISATGVGAFGLIAQSLGGGGGWVDGAFRGTAGGVGSGGAIALTLSGQVFAANTGSTAVFAQSLGRSGGGNMTLSANGLIRGGSGSGAGVRFDGGATNVITTSGSVSAVSGLAIDSTGGDDRVNNDGFVIGNVDLGAGSNSFFNRTGSNFIAFNTIDLRDTAVPGATFSNSGNFLMGLSAPRRPIDLANGETFANFDGVGDPMANLLFGARVINTVALDGNYVQTAGGHLAFDVAFGPYASDIVNVTGDATVDGTGEIILTWLENAEEVTLFSTVGVGVDNGLEIEDTLALDYSVRGDGDGVHLSFVSDFGQPFLNANGRALGAHMDSAILLGGSGGIGQLMALIGNLRPGEEDEYSYIFTELNPEPHLAPMHAQFISAQGFSNELFSCASPNTRITEKCVWARFEHTVFERQGDFENFTVEADGGRFRAGFERPLPDHWSLAGAIGYDTVDNMYVDHARSRTEGDGFHAGLGARRYSPGGSQFGVSLSGGWQWVETRRHVDIFEPLVGQSEPESGYIQASATVAHLFESGRLFARPALNGSVTALHQPGFTEEGLEGLGVESLEETQVFGTLNPELAVGVVLNGWGERQSTFTLTAGGVFHSQDEIELPFRLIGANPGAIPAMISTSLDQEALRVGADLRLAFEDRMDLRFGYVGEFGDKTENHTAGLNLRVRF